MTGFLQSLLIRGAGPSAAAGVQFATVSARPRFGPMVSGVAGENTAAPPASPAIGGEKRLMPVAPTGEPLSALPPASAPSPPHIVPSQVAANAPAQAVATMQGSTAGTTAGVATPSPPTLATPNRAAAWTAPPPAGPENVAASAPKILPDTGRTTGHRSGRTTGHRSGRTPVIVEPPAISPPPEPTPAQLRPQLFAELSQPAEVVASALTTIEIGRIEIAMPPPAPVAPQKPERTRGFAAYGQRRLGPRH